MNAVTFEAVKEQLDILGHAVPDSVVRQFLQDMHQRDNVPDKLKTQSSGNHADGHQHHVPVLGDRTTFFCSPPNAKHDERVDVSAKVLVSPSIKLILSCVFLLL
jgi:hypothetical protein